MSFKRFDQQDLVISSDGITTPAWSNNTGTLLAFYTSSDQVSRTSGDYYFNVYQENPDTNVNGTAAVQFSLAYGDLKGSGSLVYNTNAATLDKSPSSVVYKQYRTLVNGTEEVNLDFGGTKPEYIYAISIERARYKEKLLPGTFTLALGNGANYLSLTDNSNYSTTETFGDAGREYQLISGALGVVTTTSIAGAEQNGYTNGKGSYGKFLPDVGLILLNGEALDLTPTYGGTTLGTGRNYNTDDNNIEKLLDKLNQGDKFTLRSEETVSSNYIFIRARNSEFNYSTNPSNITGSGELRHDIMVDSPQSYITSVGLYNDNNDLLAVAKLSRPLVKDFTKEALIRVKLDY